MGLILFLVNWLATAGYYALLAAGFSLLFGVARVANFAHTALYMLTGFLVYTFSIILGYGLLLSSIMAIGSVLIVAIGYYVLVLNRVKEQPLAVMMVTFALALLIQETLLTFFQASLRGMEPFFKGYFEIAGVRVSYQHVFTILASALILYGLILLLSKTKLGKAIRAVSQDTEIANVMGINVGWILLLTTGISACLAGVAAVIILPLFSIEPYMWLPPLTVIIAAVVLGGLGSIKGSIFGALILAFAEVLVITFIPQGGFLRGVASMLALVGVLIFRPEGLFGVTFEEERL